MKTIGLILPICKLKLLNTIKLTNSNKIHKLLLQNNKSKSNNIDSSNRIDNINNKITRIIKVNKKVLSSFNKLITYYQT